ncbi:MAG: SusC/RagA family TonB-linked outer membrane protein [Gemmatimonadales bacterium]
MFQKLLFSRGRVLALATLALFLSVGTAFAQQGRVEGTVRNAQTRDPVANARVTVVGTNLFATTNENGYYAIENVPVGTYDVRVQVIGFQSVIFTNQRVAVGLPTPVNFQVQPSILRIEGVVVTGVAEAQQGVKLPFTVDQISGEDLPVPQIQAAESLRGKVAGAHVIRGEGTPGAGVQVLLRGATSINTAGRSNEPLYVVDGVILGANMVDVDALDIDNIEVVKGAAAAALYGARAANGVVSIKTRRGKSIPDGESRISIRSEVGANSLEHFIPEQRSHWFKVDQAGNWLGKAADGVTDTVVSPNDRALAIREHGFSTVVDQVTDSTDWDGDGVFTTHTYAVSDNPYTGKTRSQLREFFNPGTFYQNNVAISHRTGSTNFRASAHEVNENGAIEGLDGYVRRGGRVNVDHKIGTTFDFSASGYYSQSIADDPRGGENAFFGLNFYPIDVDLTELNPDPRDNKDFLINPDPTIVESNPLYSARNNDITRTRGRILGSFGMRWRPIQEFDIQADFSYDRSDRNTSEFFFKGFRTTDASLLNDGRLTKQNFQNQAINGSLSGTFTKQFGDLHTISKVRALVERDKTETFFARAQTLAVDNTKDLDLGDQTLNRVGGSTTDIRSFGWFLSTQLDFKDRYIADFLVRRDGSSLFGPDQRWHYYYRASGAYRISEESWWPFQLFDEFKLRYSRGTAGGRPNFDAQFETFNVSSGQVTKGTLGNKNLKPELATEDEFGADFIIGGRVSVEVTHARSTVEDQILQVPLAGFFGFSSQWQNAGELQTRTWEGTIQASIIQKPDLGWTFNFVIDRTRQKITEFNLPAFRTGPKSAFFVRKGEKLGTIYGDKWASKCSDILTTSGFSSGNSCLVENGGNFDINDDGLLVAVGSGNKFTDGIEKNYYGSKIDIDGTTFTWGYPVKSFGIDVTTLPDGTVFTDTTQFLQIGRSRPDFNFGVGNTFRYKGLSVYALFDAQIGGDVYNNTQQWPAREFNAFEVDQGGKQDNLKKPLDYYATLYDVNATNSHYVQDATYLKFRELSLRYSFNRSQLEGFANGLLNRISISVIGRNIKTWTGYDGYDPEVANGGDQGIFRVDQFRYPNFKTWTGSVEIEF